MPRLVAGVDGCRAGWLAAFAPAKGQGRVEWAVCATFRDLLKHPKDARVIALDMPIGLLAVSEEGGRTCDREARKLLGPKRSTSVFSPPSRAHLNGRVRRGLTEQTRNLLPKIREVDDAMTRQLEARIYEAHPELTFTRAAGHPMRESKKGERGRRERLAALEATRDPVFAGVRETVAFARQILPPKGVGSDDILDALALLWTARRIAAGKAQRIPQRLEREPRRKLRMAIHS
ncbi:MAG: DUF429 domain-containing protein [Thermoplasmatota archaeon]